MKPVYKRVLLKISGEALAGSEKFGINEEMTRKVAREIKQIHVICLKLDPTVHLQELIVAGKELSGRQTAFCMSVFRPGITEVDIDSVDNIVFIKDIFDSFNVISRKKHTYGT